MQFAWTSASAISANANLVRRILDLNILDFHALVRRNLAPPPGLGRCNLAAAAISAAAFWPLHVPPPRPGRGGNVERQVRNLGIIVGDRPS